VHELDRRVLAFGTGHGVDGADRRCIDGADCRCTTGEQPGGGDVDGTLRAGRRRHAIDSDEHGVHTCSAPDAERL